MKTKAAKISVGTVLGLAATMWLSEKALSASDLMPPFRIQANGKPIDLDVGNCAPLVTDFDGDGRFDLLLGQRGECKLRIFKNQGDRLNPKFGTSTIFKAGGVDARLPGG